jgi:hypothetical protein
MKRLAISIFILAGVLGSGCGRSDKIYSADADQNQIVAIEHATLPDGLYDQSINQADAMSINSALRLRVSGGSSAAGAFNDPSLTGSRATVGIGKMESTLLSDFALHVDSTSSTTASIRVSLLVDLKCDGGTLRAIESTVAVGASDVATDWMVAGAPITDVSGAVVLSTTPSSLTILNSEYPNACLKNGVSDAPDAIAAIPVASVQLSIGSGTAVTAEEVSISSLVLNGKTYSSWSVQ